MQIEDIEKMTLDDVRKEYDRISQSTANSLGTWQKIYEWKQQDLLNQRLEKINISMLKLTKIVTILTAVNVIVAVISVVVNLI